jgi:hypothetical protein
MADAKPTKLSVTIQETEFADVAASGPNYSPEARAVAEAVLTGKVFRIGGAAKDRDKVIRQARELVQGHGFKMTAKASEGETFTVGLKLKNGQPVRAS